MDDVQPVEQVLAEQPLRNQIAQVLVRGGNDAHVDAAVVAVRTDLLHVAGFEESEQETLHPQRHLADFVEKDRAVRSHFELAGLVSIGAGEAALHMAEQLGLEQRFGDARAVDGNERPLRARALRMDGGGDQLFADAAFARDQHLRIGARDARDFLAQLVHRRAFANQPFSALSVSHTLLCAGTRSLRDASAASHANKVFEACPASIRQRRERRSYAIAP